MSENNVVKLNKILKKFQDGNREIAYLDLKKYIESYSNDLVAIYNFAYMSEILNKLKVAIENYIYVIKKDKNHWQSRFNLYLIYIQQKNYKIALKLINEVLLIKPNYQPALRDRALTKYYLGKPDEGLTDILKSISLNTKDYIALNILGLIYDSLKENIKAKEVFEIAIKINPDYFPSYNNYGNCLQNLKDINAALINFKKAYELNNNFEEAINNIANIYTIQGKYEEAIKYYKTALKTSRETAKIYYNIGVAFSFMKDFNKAEEFYIKSQNINPNDDILKKNFAILYLAKQNYKKAWLFYDGRLNLQDFSAKNSSFDNIKHKLWKGENITNNTKILIIKEQGIGDEIIFSSMYNEAINKFPNCKIETEPRLLPIFKRVFDNEKNFVPYRYYSSENNEIKKFDKILYAGSLGRLFRNSINEFPETNFLFPKKENLIKIDSKFKNINNKLKIGIAWKSKREVYGDDKSVNLELLKPILKLENIDFINLQYGETEKEIKSFEQLHKIKIHTIEEVDLFNDFESISALLCKLDLFITISNSTAHLAGALGVPTLLIKPKNHSVFFYWNVPGDSTPWYPSIKIFEYKGSWEKTIKDIQIFLKNKFKF